MKRSATTEGAVIASARHVATSGPTRIAQRSGGAIEGVRPDRTLAREPITVVFIREDGWTLGATEELRAEAEAHWPDQWIGRMELISGGAKAEIIVKDDHGFEYTAGYMDRNGAMTKERDGETDEGEDDEAELFGDVEQHKSVSDVRPEGRSLDEIKRWLQETPPSEGAKAKAKAWKATREDIANGRVKIPKGLVTRDDFTETFYGPDDFGGEDTPHSPAVKKMKSVALPRWFAGITKERGR